MKEKNIDVMNDSSLAPCDFISLMFKHTSDSGTLYIPGWHYDNPGWTVGNDEATDENVSYRCKVKWGYEKYQTVLEKFNKHYSTLQKIAEISSTARKENKPLELEGELLDFYNVYLKPFNIGDIDKEKVCDIDERLEIIEAVKIIASKIARGEKAEDFEKQYLIDCLDVTVSEEELLYREKYYALVTKEAKQRIKESICSYDVIMRSMRLFRLLELNAPKIIYNNEARTLAAAMVLHEYGYSKQVVSNSLRLRFEKELMMDDDELDKMYRPKKTNNRKSLAPLFVYSILRDKTNSRKHLRQQEIIDELEKYPYEITIERKALSRIIHNLTDSPNYLVFQDQSGVWTEQ